MLVSFKKRGEVLYLMGVEHKAEVQYHHNNLDLGVLYDNEGYIGTIKGYKREGNVVIIDLRYQWRSLENKEYKAYVIWEDNNESKY